MKSNHYELSKKPIVTLALEIKEREFLPKILLARELASRGFRIYLGSIESVDIALRTSLSASIALHKSTFNAKSAIYRQLGHKFFFLDEEGGPTTPKSNMAEWCWSRYKSISPDNQDGVFFAEKRYLDQVRALGLGNGVRLEVTGWPRIDVWKYYPSIHEDVARHIRLEFGNFILFPTSFGTRRAAGRKDTAATISQERHANDAMDRYIGAIREIIPYLGDRRLVIRPHPKESVRAWKKIFKGQPKIIVERRGDIGPWIAASVGLIQWGSTSAIQAALAGKLNVQYKVEETKGLTDSPSFELCVNSTSPMEILDLLSEMETGAKNGEFRVKAIRILSNKNESPNERSVDKIAQIFEEEKLPPAGPARLRALPMLQIKFIFYGSHLKKYLKLLGVGGQKKVVAEKLPGNITHTEANRTLKVFAQQDSSLENIYARQVAPNLVCIEQCASK